MRSEASCGRATVSDGAARHSPRLFNCHTWYCNLIRKADLNTFWIFFAASPTCGSLRLMSTSSWKMQQNPRKVHVPRTCNQAPKWITPEIQLLSYNYPTRFLTFTCKANFQELRSRRRIWLSRHFKLGIISDDAPSQPSLICSRCNCSFDSVCEEEKTITGLVHNIGP